MQDYYTENAKIEIWKDVIGCEEEYQVSNEGRVKSLARTTIRKDGSRCPIKERILKPSPTPTGYLNVSIRGNNRRGKAYVHQLVLEAFVGPCPEGMECCHFPDQNPRNNNIDNLRWDTHKNNAKEQRHVGSSRKGEENPRSKLNDNKVIEIRNLYKTGEYSQSKLAEMFNMDQTTISGIILRKNWKHII